jgi:hypothetical protein
MEKYRKFADEGTGINPFLPPNLIYPIKNISRALRSTRSVMLSLSLVIRVPVLLLALVLIGLCDVLCYIPVISQLIIFPIIRPLSCAIALAATGVLVNPMSVMEDFRRLKVVRPSSTHSATPHQWVMPFHGFMDILVVAVVLRPRWFVFPTLGSGKVICGTVLGAIGTALQSPLSKGSSSLPAPPQSVVFGTASPTNGQALVELSPAIPSALTNPFQVCKIDYGEKGSAVAPHHLVGGVVSHVFRLMTCTWGFFGVTVYRLPEPISDPSQISVLLSRMTPSCPMTTVESSTYVKFREYWEATQRVVYNIKRE